MPVVPDHLLAVAVLVALQLGTVGGVGVATTRHRRLQSLLAVGVTLLAGAWLLLDGPFEGPTLWSFTPAHGLTVGDLLAVPSLAVAAVLLVTSRRHRPTAPSVSELTKRRALARLA